MYAGAVAVLSWSVPFTLLTVRPTVRVVACTTSGWLLTLRTESRCTAGAPGWPMAVSWVGVLTRLEPTAAGRPLRSRQLSAAWTAASELIRPEPCSKAGWSRSVAVPVMICLTTAGDGLSPWWVFRYAWMTSAASPAVSGEDWLVPPKSWIGDGPPASLVHSSYSVRSGVHRAQPSSPGAITSGTRPCWVVPPELRPEMLLLTKCPLDSCAPAPVVWM